ncbi:MAG: glycosyltransferase family 2 protein [Gemmatimonadota bacterium]
MLSLLARFTVPSWGLRFLTPPRTRLLALLAVRDGMRYIPGFLRNVSPQVDGIVALDDGSSDGSRVALEQHPSVIEVMAQPVDGAEWDEVGNHRRLIDAALRHSADWVICVDADERLEHEFRVRAERVIARGARAGYTGYAVRLRELWDDPHTFRVDGIWGRKSVARLFRVRTDHRFDEATLHSSKAPQQARVNGRFPRADLTIYHLGMLTPGDRAARRRRYELADPDNRWQRIGYTYLTDATGLKLCRPRPRRDYAD